jgi:DNA polymerase
MRRDYLTALGLETWMLRSRVTGAAAPAAAGHVSALAAVEGASTAHDSTAAANTARDSVPAAVVAANTARDSAPTELRAESALGALDRAAISPPPELRGSALGALDRALMSPPPDAPAAAAGAAREAGVDWRSLRERVAACTRCGLAKTRTQTVFGVGSLHAQWLVVGEAPGADEDRAGEPFVGRAGQLLNSMLRAIGLAREQVYIANVLKCRPPHNRDPLAVETQECLPYLERQIALLRPKIMLGVGRIAAQNLLHTDTSLGRLRQKVHAFGAARVPLVVTYHPAYLLRTPADKRRAWEDLKFAREVFTRG